MKGQFTTLLKRELWEHRSLWIAPAVVAGLFLLVAIIGGIIGGLQFDADSPIRVGGLGRHGDNRVLIGMLSMAGPLYVVSCITCFVYLLDCLYSERKDRSILFWKSLPVSDTATVLSKFALAMAVIPLAVYVLAAGVYLFVSLVMLLAAPDVAGMLGGSFGHWLAAQATLLGMLVASLLWYAPLAAWFMLASVLTRRAPILVASLPFVVPGVLESILFHTRHVWQFIGNRFSPRTDLWDTLARPDLWLGLAVAAGILYMVIRLRRYRDDT